MIENTQVIENTGAQKAQKAQKAPSPPHARYTVFGVTRNEGKMRAETKMELQRKIAEKFSQALGEKPNAKEISEDERRERTARYAELLFRSALKKLG